MSLAPEWIGKYHILKQIGCGGFAAVYKAYDTDLGRELALKVLHPYWYSDPNFVMRFRREAKTLANLRHPHVVTVYDAGEVDEQLYIAMAYLPGNSLRELLSELSVLPLELAIHILQQLASALDYAHRKGVLHRDIKPSNVILEGPDEAIQATLLDFGLVKLMQDSSALTSYGKLVGSPEYMAPEQANPDRRDEVGAAADRYALGILAYRMLAGRVPFPGNSPATLNAHENKPVPPPRKFRPDLPERVQQALLKMLAKSPAARFPSATAFVVELQAAVDDTARHQQQAALYEKLQAAAEQEDWSQVLMVGSQIAAISPGYRDVAEQIERAQQAISRRSPFRTPKAFAARAATPVLHRRWRWLVGGLAALLVVIAGAGALGFFPGVAGGPPQNPTLGAEWVRPQDGMAMIYVPGGEFLMGAAEWPDDVPIHAVTLDGFWLDRTEVTQAHYRRCVEAGDCAARPATTPYRPTHPVVAVTWDEAAAYCTWVGGRLPTEAEWEYAARSAERHRYPWGDDKSLVGPAGVRLNFCDVNCTEPWADDAVDDGYATTAPVGSFPAGMSWCGAFDLAGNVWEWVSDWYGETYYAESRARNPTGPSDGTYRVLRGGSWQSDESSVRSSYRYWAAPEERADNRGFRCVLPVE